MNKKTNTWLFILGATVFNILLTIICVILLLFLYARFLRPILPDDAVSWALPVILIGSLVLTFVIYRLVLKQLMKKINMDQYFDPIFGRRKPGNQ